MTTLINAEVAAAGLAAAPSSHAASTYSCGRDPLLRLDARSVCRTATCGSMRDRKVQCAVWVFGFRVELSNRAAKPMRQSRALHPSSSRRHGALWQHCAGSSSAAHTSARPWQSWLYSLAAETRSLGGMFIRAVGCASGSLPQGLLLLAVLP